jgi:triacylglycerol esterase/lipase EstA (alpha/beta hydrolase family)
MSPRLLTHRLAAALAAASLLTVSLAATAPAQAAETIQPNIVAGIAASLPDPAAPPPGVNNYGCKLTTAHPRPVILIPGTFANMEDDYGALAPILVNDGYCVFSLNYGGTPGSFIQSIGPVPASAQQVGTLISQVSNDYGGVQVDLIGHSQGGMLAEYVAKVLGYAPDIHAIVALSPTTHGTTLDGLTNLASFFPGASQLVAAACPACADQETGSAVISALDSGPIAQTGVSYTVIETLDEFVVTPVGSSFIHEPGVVNEYVQSSCPFDPVDHADLSYDNTTIRLVLNALDPATAKAPNCFESFPAPAIQQ